MDCIDCHNRPTHIYRSPHQLIDFYMSTGLFDCSLPYFKRYASQLLWERWPDKETALKAIEETLEEHYERYLQSEAGTALVRRNIHWLQTLYQRNFFPDQGVDWRAYPDHKSHFEFPGCYRCHDGEHKSDDGDVVSNDCLLCHEFLDQAEGEAAFGPIQYAGGPFRHPRHLGDIWKGRNCTDCHGVQTGGEYPPDAYSATPNQVSSAEPEKAAQLAELP